MGVREPSPAGEPLVKGLMGVEWWPVRIWRWMKRKYELGRAAKRANAAIPPLRLPVPPIRPHDDSIGPQGHCLDQDDYGGQGTLF